MICPNCGKDNRETNKFCTGCGTRLLVPAPAPVIDFENEETVILRDEQALTDFENEETMVLHDMQDVSGFENEETVILRDEQAAVDFENEETVILKDSQEQAAFENESTVILGRNGSESAEITSSFDPPEVPSYEFGVPVYKEPPSKYALETEYIDHLRALKQLLDDGIITESEFERKKQQILGFE